MNTRDEQSIPTFYMGQQDSIGEKATVLFVRALPDGDKTHILTNLATMRLQSAIVDDEMEEARDYFAKESDNKMFILGDADKPLIARKWRGHIFAWSLANNMWQLAVSHTEAKAKFAQAKREGCEIRALTTVGESFVESIA